MSADTLYERIGGAEAVEKLIQDLYNRVTSDSELGPFFENSALDKLKNMQTEFFSAALDGPVQYTGMDISKAHFGRGITRAHFKRYVEHLLATLEKMNISETDVHDIIARINIYADDVVGGGAGVGA